MTTTFDKYEDLKSVVEDWAVESGLVREPEIFAEQVAQYAFHELLDIELTDEV